MKKAITTHRSSDHGQREMNRRRLVVAGLATAAILVVAVGAFVLLGQATVEPSRQSAAATNSGSEYFEQAKVQIFQEERELGTMLVTEDRTAEFFLRNVGVKPLEISEVRTSCMCTFAQVIIGDEESPLFNMEMHNSRSVQSWKGVVQPGLTATIRVTYRPSLMPVQGSVARNVKFNTNDLNRPIMELGIHATVQ